jgi:CRISP-associated protein Cas1
VEKPTSTPAKVSVPTSPPDLLPARMLNEFAYCPRLAYLEWVQGEWADSADTVDGQFRHRRVTQEPKRRKPEPADDGQQAPEPIHARSVYLTSDRLQLTAKIDLVEGEGHRVMPVDYKRGKRPHIAQGAWEPERVQLCAQGLILQEHGYECDAGVLYFVGSRERVVVRFDEALVARTLQLAEEMRRVAQGDRIPAPLEDSPKCPRCSLVGICLPDEVRFLSHAEVEGSPPRPLFPAAEHALPLYVQRQGARVQKDGQVLRVFTDDALLAEARLLELSQLALFGRVQASTAVIHELCRRGIPICYFSHGSWFYGITHGMSHKNVELRRRQFTVAEDVVRSLALSRRFVQAKILNSRTLLRRNHPNPPQAILLGLRDDVRRAGKADTIETLLGIEGTAAGRYFAQFSGMLKAMD